MTIYLSDSNKIIILQKSTRCYAILIDCAEIIFKCSTALRNKPLVLYGK